MADPFTDPSTAFAAGAAAAQSVTDMWRKNQATNALVGIYGAPAGDPTAALNMQTYGFNQQADPLKLQSAQTANDQAAQQLATSQVQDPLKTQEMQNTDTTGQQTIQSNNNTLDAASALKLHGVLSGSLSDLKTSLAGVTDPTQRGALFDQEVQKMAPLVGAGDPRMLAPQLASERAQIVAGGADAVDGIQSTLDNQIMGSLSPLDRQKFLNEQSTGQLTQAKTQLAQAATTKATADAGLATAKAGAAATAPANQLETSKFFLNSAQTALATVNQAEDQLDNMSPYAPVRVAASHVPGQPEYQFQQSVDQLGHQLAISDLRNLKASGVSLGRTTNAEFLASAQALGNFDLGQDPKVIKANLERVKGMYQDIVDTQQGQLGSLTKAAAGASSGGAAVPGGTAGKVYTYNPSSGALE